MPSSQQHKEKSRENRVFLDFLIANNGPPEWIAVVAFYSALHAIERLSACDNRHYQKHQDRLAYLTGHKKHRAIHRDFAILFDASLVARYGTPNAFKQAFPGNTVVDVLVNSCLVAIEAYVDAHFNPPLAMATGTLPSAVTKP